MFLNPPIASTTKRFLNAAILPLLFVVILSQTAFAGDGTFTSTGGVNGTFDFCVVIQFNATPTQLEYIRRAFQRGSDVLADATEGHHRFGKVNLVNNCGNGCAAAASAEWFVINTPGITGASASSGGFGVHGTWGQFAISEFERIGLDLPGNDFNLNIAGFTVAHEFSHAAYDLSDEYSGVDPVNRQQRIGLGADCAPGVGPGAPPHDDPNLSYCLMDYFFGRGGMADNNIPKHMTLKEYCVASNHDPDRNNNQSLNHQNMSCWDTISRVPRQWRLPLPPGGLPSLSLPPSVPVNFGTTCGEQKVVLLIDRSGSMADESRLDFAKLGAGLFIRDLRSDGYFGLVSFADDTRVDFPLAQLTDDTKRTNAINAINALMASGNTDIGDGMISALGQLTGQNNCSVCSKTIILLTDGDHNTGTPPQDVVAQLQQANVKLDAIVIGNEVSVTGEETLKNIATQTGGKFYRLPAASTIPGFGSSGLQSLFLSLANDINGDTVLDGQPNSIATGQVKEIPVFVEQGAAFVTFAVTKMDLADNITLSLRSPSGGITNEANSQIVESLGNHESAGPDSLTLSNSQLIRVANPQAGTWTMVITAGSVRTGSIETLAMADHLGVRLNVSVSNEAAIFAPDPVEIHATPFFNASRTVGASVSGTAKRPDGSSVSITLFDDGSFDHADSVASDGIYSTRFSGYSTDGTYTFDLTATNVNGTLYEGELDDSASNTAVPPFIRKGSTTAVISGVASGEAAWVDESVPRLGTSHGDSDGGASGNGEGDNWYWVAANPAPFSGGLAHQSTTRTGFHQHYFEGTTQPLSLRPGDGLFAYVFLDPKSLPDEIMLQWNDGNNWEHRAYWGENRIGFGADGLSSRRHIGPLPRAGQWVRLEVPANLVGLENSAVSGMSFALYGGRATWDRAGRLASGATPVPTPSPADFVWVDDAVPAGSIQETVDDQWLWLPPHFSGTQGHRSIFTDHATGVGKFRAHSFRNASTPMTVQPGDVLFTYVFLDSNNMPDELVLQWYEGSSWEHRAYWGLNYLGSGILGTETDRFMGGIPPGNGWVRLEVPASYVGLEGKIVSGMAFGFYSKVDHAGINWDYSGKSSRATGIPLPLSATTAVWQYANGNSGGVVYNTSDFGAAPIKRFYAHPNQAAATVPFYRFRKPDTSNPERFYSQNLAYYTTHGWLLDDIPADRGIACYVYADSSTPGTVPLYLYHDSNLHYFLTIDQNEANNHPPVDSSNWAYVFPANPAVPAAPSQLIYSNTWLYWQDNSTDETGFRIEFFDVDSGLWQPRSSVQSNVTLFKVGSWPSRYRVRSYNAFGNSGFSNETCADCVYLDSNNPPLISVTAPGSGSVAGPDVIIQANVFDEEGAGTIAKVEFFADGTKLGEVTTPPYSFLWINAASGSHVLTAKATDDHGATTTSSPVTVIVGTAAQSSAIFSDDFNDNSLDPNKWTVEYPQGTPGVAEQSQQLQLTLAPNAAGYNGVDSRFTYDLTGRMAQVEVVQAVSQAGWAENFLSLELDANNSFLIDVGTQILFRSRVNGVNDQTVLNHSPTAHRHWRIRHDPTNNTINFETSPDAAVWTTRKTVTPGFPLTSIRFRLGAGAWGTGNGSPGAAKYDNFVLMPATADGTSGSVPDGGFESPTVGQGNLQAAPSDGVWTFGGGAGISGNDSSLTNGNPNAPEGNQVAFLQGPGSSISQTILAFEPETTYRVIFSAAQRGNCCAAGQDFQLLLDKTIIATFHPTGNSYDDYSTMLFTVAEGEHMLKFRGLDSDGEDNTAFIDNIRITAVGPTPGFYDDFNETSVSVADGAGSETGEVTADRDPTFKWFVVDTRSPATVSQELQQLRITLPASTATYNGVESSQRYDMERKMVQVEVVEPVSQAGWCENFIKVEADGNNYYLIDVGGGSMTFRSRVNGVNNQTVTGYDQSAFPYWRIRHDHTSNTVNFETSNNGTTWTTRKQVPATFSLSAVRFYLYAGAWGNGNGSPGAAKYDNFQLLDSP